MAAHQMTPTPTGKSQTLNSSFNRRIRKPEKTHFISSSSTSSFPFFTPRPPPPWTQCTILNSSASPPSPTLQEDPSSSSVAAAVLKSSSSSVYGKKKNGFGFNSSTTSSSSSSSSSQKQKQSLIGNRDRIIRHLLKSPDALELALEMYEKAKASPGFVPQRPTVKALMKDLARSKKWDSLFSLSEDVRRYGVFPDSPTYAQVIRACVKARKFKLLDDLLSTLLVSCGVVELCDEVLLSNAYSAAFRGYNKLQMYSSTVSLYEQMMMMMTMMSSSRSAGPGPPPDAVVVLLNSAPDVMKAYMKLGRREKVIELFKEVESRWILDDGSSSSSCCTTDVLSKAYDVLFETLAFALPSPAGRRRSRWSSSSLNDEGEEEEEEEEEVKVKAAVKNALLEQWELMNVRGIPATAVIYNSLICSFASMGQVELVEKLTKEGAKKQMLKDPALFMKLVSMYVEQKQQVERTLEVVAMMTEANVKVSDCVFCTIVNGFAKQRGLKPAMEVYEDLALRKGIEPGQVTLASMIGVYCRLGMGAEAERVFGEMESRGLDKCVVAYSSMIVMYGKEMKVKEAMKLVAKMKSRGCKPNVWIYNALIDLHGKAKDVRQVEKLWKEMKRRNVGADRVSYTSLIAAYNRVMEYDKCVEFYHEFRLNGGKLDRGMAGIMVGVLSTVGRVEDLIELLRDMRTEGMTMDARLFKSSLYALKDAGLESQIGWLKDTFSQALPAALPNVPPVLVHNKT